MAKPFAYIRLLRPVHWSKNVFVFAALIFAEQNLMFEPDKIVATLIAFGSFCLISSFAYVINDIHDVEQDRLHPRKRKRPLASGEVPMHAAWTLAVALVLAGVFLAFGFKFLLGVVAAAYLLLNVGYSFWFKHMLIIDVMCIAIGFVLRALAGVFAIGVPLSPWLIVCTFTLCLFVGFGKRRTELAVAKNDHQLASDRRPVLANYTLELLGHLLSISAALAVITFLLYTMDPSTAAKFGTNYLIYTVPFVVYGVFRFAVIIQTGKYDGPMELLVEDRPFQATVIVWLVLAAVIVHEGPQIRIWLHRLADWY
ncbi:MAG: decaprenyl-phosphate phosphoribosyltransferase [Phycisphaerae bacterium]|nr:decaprenyl-phosphate phosphoribosyltransferase [Phycisphaerae bacterium]